METHLIEYPKSEIIRDVIHEHVRRADQGFEKFNQSMDQNPMGLSQSIKEALEESLDTSVYLMKAKKRAQEMEAELERLRKIEILYYRIIGQAEYKPCECGCG
jgi:hypothetical protein